MISMKNDCLRAGQKHRIALFGHFGAGNLGNESTLLAMLSKLRELGPAFEVRCICTEPEVVTAEYGIAATHISSYVVRPWDTQSRLFRLVRKILIGIPSEIYRWFTAFCTLRGTDLMIVVGTGLLNNAFGLFGWGPYSIFKWTAMARLARCKVCFVSIGAGPLNGAIGRSLAKGALSFAFFRSYRDEATMQYLRAIGFRGQNDHLSPDLAFSLPPWFLPVPNSRAKSRRTVGLGVMCHGGMYGTEPTTRAEYAAYIEALLVFCQWLLDRNYDLRLLIGDFADIPVLEQLMQLLQGRNGGVVEQRVRSKPARSTADLLSQLEETDFVVATRFHNVLLGLLLNKPSISISFHRKCSALMDQMGISEYCQDIQRLSAEKLITQFCRMEENAPKLKQKIHVRVEENRGALEGQYRRIFQELGLQTVSTTPVAPVVSQVQ
jgi:polysaccharide pyruvyl transferase WcaK-like protein